MNAGRKRLPPPVNATYKFGQVIVVSAEDELIPRHRPKAEPEANVDDTNKTESESELLGEPDSK